MSVVVFILGRPGCGKTTAARWIASLAGKKGYATACLNDYDILYEMFERDTCGAFKRVVHEGSVGFDVVNFSVLDKALARLEEEARAMRKAMERGIIILEFARNNYCEALKHFSVPFLSESYFLFIESDVEVCINRIHQRIYCSDCPDNRYVSDEIVRTYYGEDDVFRGCNFLQDFQIQTDPCFVSNEVSNEVSIEDFKAAVTDFAEMIFRQEEVRLSLPRVSHRASQSSLIIQTEIPEKTSTTLTNDEGIMVEVGASSTSLATITYLEAPEEMPLVLAGVSQSTERAAV